jgi:hypothetical protein
MLQEKGVAVGLDLAVLESVGLSHRLQITRRPILQQADYQRPRDGTKTSKNTETRRLTPGFRLGICQPK